MDFLEEYSSSSFDCEIASHAITNRDLNLVGNGNDSANSAEELSKVSKKMNSRYQHGKAVYYEMSRLLAWKAREEDIYNELN